jgi:hypothetical protein
VHLELCVDSTSVGILIFVCVLNYLSVMSSEFAECREFWQVLACLASRLPVRPGARRAPSSAWPHDRGFVPARDQIDQIRTDCHNLLGQ